MKCNCLLTYLLTYILIKLLCVWYMQVLGILTAIEVYLGLQTSTIDGIDAIALKFQNIFLSMKKKQYDVLDPRLPEFDRDYDDFERYIIDLEVEF